MCKIQAIIPPLQVCCLEPQCTSVQVVHCITLEGTIPGIIMDLYIYYLQFVYLLVFQWVAGKWIKE